MKGLLIGLILIMLNVCYANQIENIGHRGARGLMPENTIASFQTALDSGATAIEMDLVITKDRQVVVSHEPFIAAKICKGLKGTPISKANEQSFNIYQMNYEQVKKYDCGSTYDPEFPKQKLFPSYKPLLSTVIEEVEQYRLKKKYPPVRYVLEVKSEPKDDNKFQPPPKQFSELIHEVIKDKISKDHVVIISFDLRILKVWNKHYPDYHLGAVAEGDEPIDALFKALGFKPVFYGPNYITLSKARVDEMHKHGIKVIPWNVNDPKHMRNLLKLGIDGLVTDYPNVFSQVVKEFFAKP